MKKRIKRALERRINGKRQNKKHSLSEMCLPNCKKLTKYISVKKWECIVHKLYLVYIILFSCFMLQIRIRNNGNIKQGGILLKYIFLSFQIKLLLYVFYITISGNFTNSKQPFVIVLNFLSLFI